MYYYEAWILAKHGDMIIFEKIGHGVARHVHCRDEGPKYRYWAVGSARGFQVARGQIDTIEGIQINRLWKKSGHNKQETLSEEKYLLD